MVSKPCSICDTSRFGHIKYLTIGDIRVQENGIVITIREIYPWSYVICTRFYNGYKTRQWGPIKPAKHDYYFKVPVPSQDNMLGGSIFNQFLRYFD